MRSILATGGSGQVGIELQRYPWPAGWDVVVPNRASLDLQDPDAITALVQSHPWSAIISAGAYTAVDKAESDVISAWQVNALAPAALAAAARQAGIPIVHVSTDYVFAGDKDGAWEVDDPVGPVNVYGASKLGGEMAIATACERYVILRTAWVVSAHGSNFVKTMLRVGAQRPRLAVVDDQRGSPTSARDLAAVLADVTMRLVDDPLAPNGVYHFSNSGDVSWAGFAREIFAQAARRGGPRVEIESISTSDYPTPARRPANSLLSHSAIERDYGVRSRAWQDALTDILEELIGPVK